MISFTYLCRALQFYSPHQVFLLLESHWIAAGRACYFVMGAREKHWVLPHGPTVVSISLYTAMWRPWKNHFPQQGELNPKWRSTAERGLISFAFLSKVMAVRDWTGSRGVQKGRNRVTLFLSVLCRDLSSCDVAGRNAEDPKHFSTSPLSTS